MNDVKARAADCANELVGRYIYLLQADSANLQENVKLLLQYAFFEGRGDGIKSSFDESRKVFASVFGGK